MNLREAILKKHSKARCTKIANCIGSSQQRFDDLFHLFLNEYHVVQRSAWTMSYCVNALPLLISNHWKELMHHLKKPNLHNAVKRNSIRLMQEIVLPEVYHGETMDMCFSYLESPKESLAVKVFHVSDSQSCKELSQN